MISYRKMTQEEFSEYRKYSNSFRGKELSEAQQVSVSEGIRLANDELDECLPSGLETAGNYLMCVEVEIDQQSHVVGYLWYGYGSGDNSAYIYDFQIFSNYRSQHYGSRVFNLLEQTLKSDGIDQIELLVAYDNERAFKLYKELGFKATGINMVKKTVNEYSAY